MLRLGLRQGRGSKGGVERTPMKFKCSKCGSNRLEEIIVNITQTSEIAGVDENDLLFYRDTSTDGGRLDRFQCSECGSVIKGVNGKKVSSMDGLVEWLKKRKMA